MKKNGKLALVLCIVMLLGVLLTSCGGVEGPAGIQGLPGANGEDGKNGADGLTPYIGSNGNWWIGETDTQVLAVGKDGAPGTDGLTPYIGQNNNWWIGETDTGVLALGKDGTNGRGIKKIEIIDGGVYVTYDDDKTEYIGVLTKDAGTDGLAYYPLPEGSYGIKAGNTEYLSEIHIAAAYRGQAVTAILEKAFTSRNLQKIHIAEGVKEIRQYAFDGCTEISEVIIPASMETIGFQAFNDCNTAKLTKIFYGGTSEEWKAIAISSGNYPLTAATVYCYAETEPSTAGNYWHMVDGVPTVW